MNDERRDAIAWARSVTSSPDVVYIDTETTGFLRPGEQIIEISVIGSDGSTLLDTLLKSKKPIPPAASQVHGITDNMLENAPQWHEIYDDLREVIAGKQVVIYNRDFDFPFINQMNVEFGLPVFSPEGWHCAMKQYARYAGVWNFSKNDWKWHKLELAHRTFSDDQMSAHRAADDARACRVVVLGMAGSKS